LWFAQFSLTPWVRKIEAEFTRSVFGGSSGYELEIDLSGLMRGDYAARWAAYAVAVQNNILDVNEIREAEGYNPRPAGASDAAP
jgi:phage portal protein BeeE